MGAFVASGALPMGVCLSVMQDTPGADNSVAFIGLGTPTTVVAGPGTFRVVRPANASGVNVGAFTEA